jgi:poly(A) polymerase
LNEPIARGSSPPAATSNANPVSADRALTALDVCVQVAERGAWVQPPVASIEDYRKVESAKLRDHLERVLMSRNPEGGLDAMLACGVLDALLPEVRAMVGMGDGEFRHKDVWKHTKQVVRQAVPRTEVRWAALLHDIGKVKTRRISPDGEVHFFGHAEVGASMFDRMQRRVPLFAGEESFASSVRFLILHHLRASQYDKSWTDSAVRRFAKEMGPGLCDLLDLSRADITTKSADRKRRGLESISELAARVRSIQEMDAKIPPLPKGLGTEISARFGIAPSPLLGDLMKALKTAVDDGDLEAQREPDYYLAALVERVLVPAK